MSRRCLQFTGPLLSAAILLSVKLLSGAAWFGGAAARHRARVAAQLDSAVGARLKCHRVCKVEMTPKCFEAAIHAFAAGTTTIVEFPCSAPQRDGKLLQMPGNLLNVG